MKTKIIITVEKYQNILFEKQNAGCLINSKLALRTKDTIGQGGLKIK